MDKPAAIFDRQREWQRLTRFIAGHKKGATLGLVYGRRRQGKTFLLESLTEAHDGFYFQALRQSEAQNLERLAQAYQEHTGSLAPVAFPSWESALNALLALGDGSDRPVPVVIDELPYLLDTSPHLPSLVQALFSPRSKAATTWPARLILCGSTMSVMGDLLAEGAPLRGRASLEQVVHPFTYREAAKFWQVEHDLDLAVRLNALVGGTAGYRDMSGGAGPVSSEAFDEWVVEALLDPASAMFREGQILLAEESKVSDTSVYFSILAALTLGKTRRGEIASTLGRSENSLAHPLSVLTEARLIEAQADALKQRRTCFKVTEPILRLHQAVIAPNESRLTRHQGSTIWAQVADTVASRIYGPHFEDLARTWCLEHAAPQTLGIGDDDRAPSRVAPTEVACAEHRTNHEIDIVVLAPNPSGKDDVVAIGEAKWRTKPCDQSHLRRLEHLRNLLKLPDTTMLLLVARSGFTSGLVDEATTRRDVELVDLDRLYTGS
jgi:hypothetical protein